MKSKDQFLRQDKPASATARAFDAKVRVQQTFAVRHLLTAALFARRCYEIEKEHEGEAMGPFFDEIVAYASACAILSVAALEANINELYEGAQQSLAKRFSPIWDEFSKRLDREKTLVKYQWLLKLKGKEKMNEGRPPFQEVRDLIAIRDALVHFRPEYYDEEKLHSEISKNLRAKSYPRSPFVTTTEKFPLAHMCHGFAEWAVTSSLNFMEAFSERAGLPSRFESFKSQLATRP